MLGDIIDIKKDLIRCREYYYILKQKQEEELKNNERLSSIVESAIRYNELKQELTTEPKKENERLFRIKEYVKTKRIIDGIRNKK